MSKALDYALSFALTLVAIIFFFPLLELRDTNASILSAAIVTATIGLLRGIYFIAVLSAWSAWHLFRDRNLTVEYGKLLRWLGYSGTNMSLVLLLFFEDMVALKLISELAPRALNATTMAQVFSGATILLALSVIRAVAVYDPTDRQRFDESVEKLSQEPPATLDI